MRSLIIAFAMYSKIPVPQVEWDDRSLSRALCWFPLIGAVIGAALWGWMLLWRLLDLGALGAAGAVLLPLALSGAIHLDGFCDTCDALSSHQSRERKLEILKDSHTGAFAIICCGLYLLVFFAAWREADLTDAALPALASVPLVSRCLSGLAAVSWRNARGTGLLATFTAPMDGRRARLVLLLESAAALALMAWLCWRCGPVLLAVPAAALLTLFYYRRVAFRQFGGITGDTEGFFLQVCECAAVVVLTVCQKLEGFL